MSLRSRDIEDRAFRFACDVVRFCNQAHQSGGLLSRLLYQLAGASTAVGSNLEEAAEGQSRADFIAKACIARKEARESRYWLRLIAACYEQHRAVRTPLLKESSAILAILSAIIRNARANTAASPSNTR
jgi:four helix bundle protein